MADVGEKAREEFFSEAQELIETLSRSLLALDELQGDGAEDPDVINEAFRAVHTLKSLAGIFGNQAIGTLSHRLEDVLDRLRLGKLPLDANLLDVLFKAVELYWQLLAHERQEISGAPPSIDKVLGQLRALASSESVEPSAEFDIEPQLLSVLTEYEEHRLRSCVKSGLSLFRVRVRLDLATIDKELESIKTRAKPLGEVITYLPTGESTSVDTIELDLLLASGVELSTLRESLGGPNIAIEPVGKRAAASLPVEEDNADGPRNSITVVPPPASPMTEGDSSPLAVMRSVSQTVRVDIRRLDSLMNAVGELAIVRGALARIGERARTEGNRQLGSELYRLNRTFDRKLSELQEGILEVRMVPLSQVFDRLTRVVRQISRELGKEIRLVITGGETEIDKLLVEELSDPLMHIVRNAIDHGIEAAAERVAIGKAAAGTIALNAFQKGNHVVLEVEDDGGGVNTQNLVDRAVQLGQLSASEALDLSRGEALNLMFLPGLSTREEAGDYSGRGVGMDVVKTNIGKLGGVIDLQSEPNIGTQITVTLPITLAIVSALLVRCQDRIFAISLTSVSEALSWDPGAVKVVDGRDVMTLRGASLPLCRIAKLFDLPEVAPSTRRQFVVVTNAGLRRLGLVVDELLGQQDIVIKALGQSLSRVRGFAGATELGDQRVALVLDAGAIIEEVLAGAEVRGMLLRGDHA
jgi:two-component system, chemotaxis family, sensor kinase CheA